MRILYIHGDQRGPGQGGGAESLLRDQAEAMKRLGHPTAWWYGQGRLQDAIEQFRPDLCHLMTTHCYQMGMFPARFLQERELPHLWHIQDYWPFCQPRMLLVDADRSCSAVEGACGNECGGREIRYLDIVNRSYVVAGNEHTADIYRRSGLRCDAVGELGIDTELFAPGEKLAGSIYTSTAWPDQPVKGMHILRQALAGTGLDANLITGLPRERVAGALRQADIFVFPSCYQETWGLCLTEAMASGCACIASDVAGARAQIHEGLGLLVPPRDPIALRHAIEWLLGHPEERLVMGERARQHVEQDHSLEAMGKRWEAVYSEVMAKREVLV